MVSDFEEDLKKAMFSSPKEYTMVNFALYILIYIFFLKILYFIKYQKIFYVFLCKNFFRLLAKVN